MPAELDASPKLGECVLGRSLRTEIGDADADRAAKRCDERLDSIGNVSRADKPDQIGFVLVLQQCTDHALAGAHVADQRVQQGFGGARLTGRQSAEILAAIAFAWWDRHVKHEQGVTGPASPS